MSVKVKPTVQQACPNCSYSFETASVEATIDCPRCGYRSEMAREYLWLYAGGLFLIAAGFLLGLLSVLVGDPPADHWSLRLAGWFPAGPWSRSYLWIGCIVEGIVLSLAGLGLSRHRRGALALLGALVLVDAGFAVRKLLFAEPHGADPQAAGLVLGWTAFLLALGLRCALALTRTPRRNVLRLQTFGESRAEESGS